MLKPDVAERIVQNEQSIVTQCHKVFERIAAYIAYNPAEFFVFQALREMHGTITLKDVLKLQGEMVSKAYPFSPLTISVTTVRTDNPDNQRGKVCEISSFSSQGVLQPMAIFGERIVDQWLPETPFNFTDGSFIRMWSERLVSGQIRQTTWVEGPNFILPEQVLGIFGQFQQFNHPNEAAMPFILRDTYPLLLEKGFELAVDMILQGKLT